jgi:hypothetical protein
MSVFGLFVTNWAMVPIVYALDHFDTPDHFLVLCRTRGYIVHVNGMCFRYTLLLMCADRYALCSSRVSIRLLCRPQLAYRSIGILLIFWMVFSSHLLIWESIENNRCAPYGIYGQIFSVYTLIFTGIIPILTMISIGLLVMNALRQLRSRVGPLDNTRRLNRRDTRFMKLVLVEVVFYILFTFTYPFMLIYTTITNNIVSNKSAERKQIESFLSFITLSLLLYLNYNATFYVHIFTSATYRAEVKKLILKLMRKVRAIQQTQEAAVQPVNQT